MNVDKLKELPNSKVILLGLAGLGLLLIIIFIQNALHRNDIGEQIHSSALIENEIGIVEAKSPDSSWSTIPTELRIYDKSFVKTGPQSKATIILPGNNEIRLSENSQLSIDALIYTAKSDTLTISVRNILGSMWLQAPGVLQKKTIIQLETFNGRVTTSQASVHVSTNQENDTDIKVIDGAADANVIARNNDSIDIISTTHLEKNQQFIIAHDAQIEKKTPEITAIDVAFQQSDWLKWNQLKDSIVVDLLHSRKNASSDLYVLDASSSTISTQDVLQNEDNYSLMNAKKLEAYIRAGAAHQQELKITNEQDLQALLGVIADVEKRYNDKFHDDTTFWKHAMIGISALRAKDKLDIGLIKAVLEELTINFQ